ncbi:DUF2628 domain-containing protein [Microbacteriaceae bacterium K1510]|nr:DUF2628 domain-containing protein [Microbacteriaceae bacterium K1510]
MPTYTVHAPPPKSGETTSAPERFRFVRDGFHFWAFLLTPLWLLVHRLWLALVIYVVLYAAFGVGLALLGASPNLQAVAGVLIALVMGFEASSIRRWTLSRRGWQQLGFVVGDDEEMAERRFYAEWAKHATDKPAASPPSEPTYMPMPPVRRDPPSGHDVIGLFPEPERPR